MKRKKDSAMIRPPKREVAEALVIRKRRQAIRDLMLQSIPLTDICIRLGVGYLLVLTDIRAIFLQWAKEDEQETKDKIAQRVRQLELSAQEAYDGYQRSKNNTETITTSYDEKSCPKCKGKTNGKSCERCNGKGYVLVENVVRRVRGNAGDATLLRTYMKSICEAAKLQGLYLHVREQYTNQKKPREVFVSHIHAGINWNEVPTEKILQIKYACAEAAQAIKTLDVDSEPVDKENE